MIVKRFFEPLLAQASYLIGCAADGRGHRHRSATATPISTSPPRRPRTLTHHARHRDAHPRRLPVRQPRARRADRRDAAALGRRRSRTGSISSPPKARWCATAIASTSATSSLDVVAHARPHAGTPDVPRSPTARWPTRRSPRPPATSSSSAMSAGPTCSSGPPTSKGTMEKSARTLYRSLQAFNAPRGLAADLAGPRRRIGLRQGHQRGAAQHARLRAALQLGLQARRPKTTFVASVLAGQPDPPTYFATMKRLNKEGPRVLGGFPAPPRLDDHRLSDRSPAGASSSTRGPRANTPRSTCRARSTSR